MIILLTYGRRGKKVSRCMKKDIYKDLSSN